RREVVVINASGYPAGVLRAEDLAGIAPERLAELRVRELRVPLAARATAASAGEPATDALARARSVNAEYLLVLAPSASGTPQLIGMVGPAELQNAVTLRALHHVR